MESLINVISHILFGSIGYLVFTIGIILIAILLPALCVKARCKKQIENVECFIYIFYFVIAILTTSAVYVYFYIIYDENQLYLQTGAWDNRGLIGYFV